MTSSRACTPHGAGHRFIVCALLFVSLCLAGCGEDDLKSTAPPPGPSGDLVEYSGCKQFEAIKYTLDQDCLFFDYDGKGTLRITHMNAGFNCCPGEIVADVTIEDSVITIVENESESACRCLCLYDLRYEIEQLTPGTYTVLVAEPYTEEGDEPLACTIDLSAAAAESCCVRRNHYPWESGAAEPSGFMIRSEGCKTQLSDADGEDFADIDCIEYEYINGNVLRIKHINAGFNCCPGEISAEITFEGNAITITESESESVCDCLCLFDLEYEIMDLAPGVYSIRIVEPYLITGDPPLVFTADLAAQPRFRYCVERSHYPWEQGGTEADDISRLERLKKEITDLIGVPSCGGPGDCRSIAFGAKPCGGPWEYLVYSATPVDVDVLVRKVNAYNALNAVLNARHQWNSDCRMVGEPRIGCVGGICIDLDRLR